MSVEGIPLSSMRALAQHLLILECGPDGPAGDPTGEALRVFERLRVALARFAGLQGFTSLMRRALALAKAVDPALRDVSVTADGSLDGLEQVAGDAVVAIVAQFLGLLVTFIGEPLTLHLVRDAWPEASLDDGYENHEVMA